LLCYPTPLFKAPADSVALDTFSAGSTRFARKRFSSRAPLRQSFRWQVVTIAIDVHISRVICVRAKLAIVALKYVSALRRSSESGYRTVF
jgi:hypothetical protein